MQRDHYYLCKPDLAGVQAASSEVAELERRLQSERERSQALSQALQSERAAAGAVRQSASAQDLQHLRGHAGPSGDATLIQAGPEHYMHALADICLY